MFDMDDMMSMRMTKNLSAALLAFCPMLAGASEVLLMNAFRSKESLTYAISNTRAAKLPAWSPGSGNPPFSIGAAIKVAVHHRGKPTPTGIKWPVNEVRLSHTASDAPTPVWFYQVALKGQDDIVVLMDGSIVAPQVRKH